MLRTLTAEQKVYLRGARAGAPAPVGDQQSGLEIANIAGIAEQTRVALARGNDPAELGTELKRLSTEIIRLGGPPAGAAGRATLMAWFQADASAGPAFVKLCAQLKERLLALDQQEAGRAAAPKTEPPTNEEILAAELGRQRRANAPGDGLAHVTAILVVDGAVYRGKNAGGEVGLVTAELVRGLADKGEKWSISNCAEVHALDAFVKARTLADKDAVTKALKGSRAIIATVSAQGQPLATWGPCGACEQCRQWLEKLGIAMVKG